MQPSSPEPGNQPNAAEVEKTIELRFSGKTFTWDPSAASILEFLEAKGLEPDFSCRAGICSTCSVELLEGQVIYHEEPLDPPEDDEALLCCSKPQSSIVLNM